MGIESEMRTDSLVVGWWLVCIGLCIVGFSLKLIETIGKAQGML